MAKTKAKLDDDRLIEKYVDLDTDGYPHGRVDARLKEYGMSVWALINYLRIVDGDVDRVLRDYDIPGEAMDAALAYYRRHKALIDAWLLVHNDSW